LSSAKREDTDQCIKGERMKPKFGMQRIGKCRHTGKRIKQAYDGVSDDADDEFGWLCLHTEED
jgi:hypothetical protein